MTFRSMVRGLGLATALAIAAAGTAQGASTLYWDSNSWSPPIPVDQYGWTSNWFYLTNSHGRSEDGNTVCVAAWDNGGQVGQVSCSSTVVVKPFNGSYRKAFGRATIGNTVKAKLRAEYP